MHLNCPVFLHPVSPQSVPLGVAAEADSLMAGSLFILILSSPQDAPSGVASVADGCSILWQVTWHSLSTEGKYILMKKIFWSILRRYKCIVNIYFVFVSLHFIILRLSKLYFSYVKVDIVDRPLPKYRTRKFAEKSFIILGNLTASFHLMLQ